MLKMDLPEEMELSEEASRMSIRNEIEKGANEIKEMLVNNFEEKQIQKRAKSIVGSERLLHKYIIRETVPVKVYKIDLNVANSSYKRWEDTLTQSSGAEKFVVFFSVVLTLMNYTRSTSGIVSKEAKSVLILDNPFGKITSAHLLKPMFDIAKHFNVQLICLSDINKSDVTSCFECVIKLVIKQQALSNFEIMTHEDNERIEHGYYANRTRFTRPMLCYAVWFPSIEFKPNDELPPEAAVEITFDKKSLLNAQSVIEDAYDFWKDKLRVNTRPLSGDDTRCVMDVLCPYFHAVPKLGTTINESEHIYIRLTNQQIALLDFLVEQDTAVIHGLAGTGKTVLAIEKAKMLAAQGESVLFLCYNSFLRDSLRENNTIPGVVFHNAHSLAYEIMGATDSKIDDVLAEFEEYLEVVFDKENWKYKNVIVDEGQDLDDRLLNRLYDLSKSKKGSFYVFYDKNQFIMKKRQPHWLEDAECRLVLSKNCRNTAEIFKTACSIIGKENLTLNEIHGEVPFLRFYSTEKEMTAIVEGFLERMKKGEVPADKITILSASTLDNSFIDAKRKYAGFELSEKREPGKVHFTTIRKFKGLEAEAILVVDASMIGLKSEEDRRLLYVGVSRAKNYLEIAMNQDIADSELGDYLHALNPNRSLPRNKKGLKRLLNVDI